MKKVFLGGTCNESTWREKLIKLLNIDYFNPVVDDWTLEAAEEEIRQRKICDYCLYVITPRMTGVYSIAEVVDDSNKRPSQTILCVLEEDGEYEFNKSASLSLNAVKRMVSRNGAKVFNSLYDVADYLNKQ